MSNRIGGTFNLTIDGEVWLVKGNFTINLGKPKREAMVGHDKVHGFKELPQAPSMSGEFSIPPGVAIADKILGMTSSTVSLKAANGATYFIEQAFYTGDGNIETEEGKIQFECSGMNADEVTA